MKKILSLFLLIISYATYHDIIIDQGQRSDFSTNYYFNSTSFASTVRYDFSQYDDCLILKRIVRILVRQLSGKGFEKEIINSDSLFKTHFFIKFKRRLVNILFQ